MWSPPSTAPPPLAIGRKPLQCVSSSSQSERLGVLNLILEHTEARDLHAYRVPGLGGDGWLAREAHTGWRTSSDQVAWRQCQKLREIAHQVAHVEDEVLRVAVLHEGTIHPRLEVKQVGVGDLGLVCNIGSHWGQGIAHLASRPLARHELEVAGTGVVDDGVAVDIAESLLLGDVARSLANDHTQLDFPIEPRLAPRP